MNDVLEDCGVKYNIRGVAYALLDASMWFSGANAPVGEELARKLFPVWIGFLALGIWARRSGLSRMTQRSWIAISLGLVATFALYVVELSAVDREFGATPLKQFLLGGLPFQLLGGFAMLAGIASLETTRIAERLAKVGGDTYGIYLSHVAIMVLLYRKLQSGGLIHVRAIEVPVVALMSFILAWIFVRLVRRVPFALPLLPGETQRHQLHLRSARDSRIE